MLKTIRILEERLQSFKAFASTSALILFIVFLTAISAFYTCLFNNYNTLINIKDIYVESNFEITLINTFKCLLISDNVGDFYIDNTLVEVFKNEDNYTLITNDLLYIIEVKDEKIISYDIKK